MRQITQAGNLQDVALTQTLPPALQYDAKMTSLAESLAMLLRTNAALIVKTCGIYYRIEELEENVLDILAADLHADWYDYNGTLQQKRTVIKNNVAIHRKMGTVAGLKTAIESVMGSAELTEWFQYGGDPFYFRVYVDAKDITGMEKYTKLLDAIQIYKPVRARLDRVTEKSTVGTKLGVAVAAQVLLKLETTMEEYSLDNVIWLTDEDSDILLNEDGYVLFEN